MITVNGKTYSGNDLTIVNDKIMIDGKVMEESDDIKEAHTIIVKGDVHGNISTDKNVNCNNVGKDVNARGSVNCDDVRGYVHAGGSVNCDDVMGDIVAGGSVKSSRFY